MAYVKTDWQDTIKDGQGNVIEKGTALNAAKFNKMEDALAEHDEKVTQHKEKLSTVTEQLAQTVQQGNGIKTLNLETQSNVTDFSTFIVDKINEGYRRFIVPEGIILNQTLEIKNIRDKGIIFSGVSTADVDGANPNFILNTGGVGIKTVNCHGIKFENLSVSSLNAANPSTIAFHLTREDKEDGSIGSAHSHNFNNVSIRLGDNLTLNSGRGTIGIYNDTVEMSGFGNMQIRANTPIIMTKADLLGLQPTNSYQASLKDVSFYGYMDLMVLGGSGLVIDGCININGMFYAGNIGVLDNLNIGAVEILGYCSGINLNVDSESFKVALLTTGRLENSNVFLNSLKPKYPIKISETTLNVYDSTYKKGQIVGSTIKTTVAWDSSEIEKYVLYAQAGSNGVANSILTGVNRVKNEAVIANAQFMGDARPTIDNSGAGTATYSVFLPNKIGLNSKDIAFSYGAPSASLEPLSEGSPIFNTQVTSNEGSPAIYIKKTDGTFVSVGQLNYRTIPVANIPTTTPKQKGEIIFDSNYHPYIAYGTAQGNFYRISSEPRILTASPVGVNTPAFIGQEILDSTNKVWYKSTGLTNADWVQINN